MKTLYFGDCLNVLKELCPQPNKSEGFIDLIYIDPPFNSKRDYNVLFEEAVIDATAQKKAFADTWSNVSYYDTLDEIRVIDLDLYTFLNTLNNIHISKSAVSYLTTMAIRIWYMHKVLKDTGSFYLHCDPTMSHYLKILCDLIFGEKNYKNELVWKRTSAHSDSGKFGNNIDIILFYTKSENYIWNHQFTDHGEEYLKRFHHKDKDGRFWTDGPITAKGLTGGGYEYEYKGIKGYWRCPLTTMERLDKENKLHFTKNDGIRLKKYLDENKGNPLQALIDDIPPINSQANERLGYPTQKPEALLERIIKASSNEGDLVADFFCGCGTTIAVAEKLNRNWLGVDISHLAIKLIKKRLVDKIETTEIRNEYSKTIEIKGFPQDIASAKALAREDYDIQKEDITEAKKIEDKKLEKKKTKGRVRFQEWIVEVMLGAVLNPKLTADGGWDGHEIFEVEEGKKETVLIEVKSGNVNVKNMREFIQVVNSQKAAIGVFVCFGEQVTRPMLEEATKEGYYRQENYQKRYAKIQILTVEDLLNGQGIKFPPSTISAFKKSQTTKTGKTDKQEKMF